MIDTWTHLGDFRMIPNILELSSDCINQANIKFLEGLFQSLDLNQSLWSRHISRVYARKSTHLIELHQFY